MRGTLMLASLLAFAPGFAIAQSSKATPEAIPYVMPRSEVLHMRSAAGAEYVVYIAWPEAPPPPGGYPILYMLDGTESFAIAAEYANRLGSYVGLTPGVVVAIGYPGATRRELDYSPATPKGVDIAPVRGPTGGADIFLDFLATRLIPAVEKGRSVNADRRTLAGYSFGGLFTLHALFNRPELFRNYAASSPSIWYGDKQVLKGMPGLSDRLAKPRTPRRLLLTAGEYEQSAPPGMEQDPSWLKIADLSLRAKMIDNARALSEQLRSAPMQVEFRVHAGETHASGDWPAIRDALRLAFATQP